MIRAYPIEKTNVAALRRYIKKNRYEGDNTVRSKKGIVIGVYRKGFLEMGFVPNGDNPHEIYISYRNRGKRETEEVLNSLEEVLLEK